MEVEKERVPPDMELEVGQQLILRQPEGGAIRVTVTEITDSTVTLDANHPLAGEDLIFEVQLVAVEEDQAVPSR